eukprot:GHVN01003379.1.p1 GENE.GHVN01003379.1~~GHVN01003379.1.p1  ORF type:complete len:715 (+),score=89.24 GHVN01003379.1:769-2913(+)
MLTFLVLLSSILFVLVSGQDSPWIFSNFLSSLSPFRAGHSLAHSSEANRESPAREGVSYSSYSPVRREEFSYRHDDDVPSELQRAPPKRSEALLQDPVYTPAHQHHPQYDDGGFFLETKHRRVGPEQTGFPDYSPFSGTPQATPPGSMFSFPDDDDRGGLEDDDGLDDEGFGFVDAGEPGFDELGELGEPGVVERETTTTTSTAQLKPGKRTPIVLKLNLLQALNFSQRVGEAIIDKQDEVRDVLSAKGIEPKLTADQVDQIWSDLIGLSQTQRQERLNLSMDIGDIIAETYPSLYYLENGDDISANETAIEVPTDVSVTSMSAQANTSGITPDLTFQSGLPSIVLVTGLGEDGFGFVNAGEPGFNEFGELEGIASNSNAAPAGGMMASIQSDSNTTMISETTSTTILPQPQIFQPSPLGDLARQWNATTAAIGAAQSAKYQAMHRWKNNYYNEKAQALNDLTDTVEELGPIILNTSKVESFNNVANSVENFLTAQWLGALNEKVSNVSTAIFNSVMTTPIRGGDSIADVLLGVNQSQINDILMAKADLVEAKAAVADDLRIQTRLHKNPHLTTVLLEPLNQTAASDLPPVQNNLTDIFAPPTPIFQNVDSAANTPGVPASADPNQLNATSSSTNRTQQREQPTNLLSEMRPNVDQPQTQVAARFPPRGGYIGVAPNTHHSHAHDLDNMGSQIAHLRSENGRHEAPVFIFGRSE